MIKDFFYYLFRGQYNKASIHLSVFLYWYKIKLIKGINRTYRRVWPIIFITFISIWVYCGAIKMRYDYSLIENYAHFEALSSDFYTRWMTDGSPGQDPPEK
jgi:hypothetical protein